MYKITKQYHFSASHQILGLPENHPCSRLHGHNYVVEIELKSETLNNIGFIRDYYDLDAFHIYIKKTIDHRHINDVLGNDCVTAEQLAKHFFDWCKGQWPEVSAVCVSETAATKAEYRP